MCIVYHFAWPRNLKGNFSYFKPLSGQNMLPILPTKIIGFYVYCDCHSHRCGWPPTAVNKEAAKKLTNMNDRWLSVDFTAESVGISNVGAYSTLTENLLKKKFCAWWVPRMLSHVQKVDALKHPPFFSVYLEYGSTITGTYCADLIGNVERHWKRRDEENCFVVCCFIRTMLIHYHKHRMRHPKCSITHRIYQYSTQWRMFFPEMKELMKGRKFVDDDQDQKFLCSGIRALKNTGPSASVGEDYVEKWQNDMSIFYC